MKKETNRELYEKALKWIKPIPQSLGYRIEYKLEHFVKNFNISEQEALNLVNELIKNNKLKKLYANNTYVAIRICDICGKEFDVWDLEEDHHHSYYFGYGSKYDEQYIEFDVCADCFDYIVDTILPLFPNSPIKDAD